METSSFFLSYKRNSVMLKSNFRKKQIHSFCCSLTHILGQVYVPAVELEACEPRKHKKTKQVRYVHSINIKKRYLANSYCTHTRPCQHQGHAQQSGALPYLK